MAGQTITISKKEYEKLLEQIGIMNNKEMMEMLKESERNRKKGFKGIPLDS